MDKKGGGLTATVVLALIYFCAAKLGLRLAFIHPSATAIWAPTGIALTAFLLFGYSVWPGIFLGAFLANLTTAGSVLTSIGIAAGNTLEGATGCYLVSRFAGGLKAFQRAQDVFKFAFFAGLVSTTVSATVGVTTLALGGFASWASFGAIWWTWWLGDAVGAIIVAPFLVLWYRAPQMKYSKGQVVEAAAFCLILFFVGEAVFGGVFDFQSRHFQLEYLCIPIVTWGAFRLGRRLTMSAILLLSVIAIWGTLTGSGPFLTRSPNEFLLILQVFLGVLALMGLVLATSVEERKRAADRFELAVESAPNAVVMMDAQGKIVLVNAHAAEMFGYGREELVGQPVEVLVPERFRSGHPQHRMEFSAQPRSRPMGAGRDLYAVRKDGSEFPVEIGLNPLQTEEGLLVLSAIVDISERKRAEVELRRLTKTDPLTGLANYREFFVAIDREIRRYGRSRRSFALLLIDLDGLKTINDTYGHLVGNRALRRLAEVLRAHSREIDTPARYGGDEFALVLPETTGESARQIANRIRDRVANDGEKPPISLSVGIAVFPDDGLTLEMLLSRADQALYEMKRRPRTPAAVAENRS
jgi:diguanylate cyclase (GGDEF)-like protein/PAS domain S-box-containing protein